MATSEAELRKVIEQKRRKLVSEKHGDNITSVNNTHKVRTERTSVPKAATSTPAQKEVEKVVWNTVPSTYDVISDYESIPEYNLFERLTDASKKVAYDRKQSLLPTYKEAKKSRTENTMSNNNISIETIEHALGNIISTDESGLDMGTLQQKHNDALQQLNNAGLSLEDAEDYYYNVYSQQKTKDYFAKEAEENPVKSTMFSFPVNAIGGVAGTLEGASSYLTGKPIDSDSGMFMPTKGVNITRDTVSKDMGTVGKTLYDAGTGIGDNLTSLALTGGKGLLAGAVQGLQGFSNSTIDAAERGLTPNKIMGTAATNAALEAAMEAIPLGRLGKIANGTDKSVKNVLKNVGSQMLTEGATEAATEASTSLLDRAINQDLSKVMLRAKELQTTGMTEEQAKQQAWKEVGSQTLYAGIVGGISGGAMGGGASAISSLRGLDPLNALGWQTKEDGDTKQEAYHVPSALEKSSPLANVQNVHENSSFDGNIPNLAENVKAGKATIIKKAYSGETPVQKTTNSERVQITQESYDDAVVNMDIADIDSSLYGRNIKKILTKVYENIFAADSTSKDIVVNGTRFANKPYSVTVNKSAIGKIMSDPNLSAEKIAVIDNIGEIVGNANFVGSGSYVPHGSKKKSDVTRYDYFETAATIGNQQYIVTFDVEVHPNTNNYRTHKIINEINLTQSPGTGPVPAADSQHGNDVSISPTVPVETSSLSNNNIPNLAENVNGSAENVQYNAAKIDGFDSLNKDLDRLVGMYGNDEVKTLYVQMKSAVNEYVQTNKQEAIDRAVTLAAEIDEKLVGRTYTRKGSGKNSVKGQKAGATTTFAEGDFVNTLFDYGNDLRDVAKSNEQQSTVIGDAVQNDTESHVKPQVQSEEGNQRIRSYNETLINKTDAPQELKNEFINNPDIYTQLSNKETAARADEVLANNDINAAIARYHSMLDSKDPAAIPLGYNLSKKLSESGRLDESVQLVREMSKALTESGQFSQAAAITMLNNNPEAAKRYLVREIDTMNQKGREKFGKKWKDFELSESELQQFTNIKAGDEDAIKAAYDTVYSRLRKQYPSTMTEKLMELRRVSMLLNVRTNVRNIVSNAMLMPVRWTADRVSALGEGAYCLINPKYQRTQSLNPIRSKQTKKLASEAFEMVKSELLGDNKYEDAKGAMRDKQVFKGSKAAQILDNITNGAVTKANQAMGKDVDPSLLETARNFTYFLLQEGDNAFVKKNFESRMASYLAAQGITDLENIPADAYTLATQEALKATFKDDSALANGLSAFRQMLNKAPTGMLGDVVMPFTKTPANLAMRGIDYSPAGVYNAVKTLRGAKNNADIAKGMTQLGQSVTGTAAILLGMALAEAGWITGALSEDKDEAQFQKQQGQLAYSFKIGDNYFTYDWAQPASIPLILGVTIYDSWNNKKDFINGLKQGTLAAIDSWLELSPLQNLSDIFGGYGTPAENVWDVVANDFPLSFIPAQLGAAAKVGDTTQRVTYDNSSNWNSFLNQAKAKVPGSSESLPVAYDTWGNPIQRQDSTGEAVFANLLNPGQFGNANVTPIDGEISNLYDATGSASVFPKKAAWSYKVNGEQVKLNSEQYSEFQRIMGENAFDMASSLIGSDAYNALSDEQRVGTIEAIYSFADALAKSEVLGYDVENSDTYKKTYAVFSEKGAEGVATYLSIKQSLPGTTNADKVAAVNALELSAEEKGYYLSKLITLSKSAQEAYAVKGYAGVYEHYSQEVLKERLTQLREQSLKDRIKAMRSQMNNNG